MPTPSQPKLSPRRTEPRPNSIKTNSERSYGTLPTRSAGRADIFNNDSYPYGLVKPDRFGVLGAEFGGHYQAPFFFRLGFFFAALSIFFSSSTAAAKC